MYHNLKYLLALLILGCAVASMSGQITTYDLRTEHGVDPIGIDREQPRISWKLKSPQRGQLQRAWQVQAASSAQRLAAGEADLWDSGRVDGAETLNIAYAGEPLQPAQQVFWRVRAWDAAMVVGEWSAPAQFTMGLWQPQHWADARWIGAATETESILLRREFRVGDDLSRALVFVSGLGHYVLSLNGARTGVDLLTPSWSQYAVTTLYDSYDITAQLRYGDNAIGLMLGNGMFHVERSGRFAKFQGSHGNKRAVVLLRLEYADGRVENLTSGREWQTHAGPVTFSNMYGGEDFDARKDPPGWRGAGFDASAWPAAVEVATAALDTLRGHRSGSYPVRTIEVRRPVAVRQLAGPGSWLYDFGQNTSYMPRLRISGPRGSRIRIIPGERIFPDGLVSRSSMGGIHRDSSWWEYTKASDAEEEWQAEFFYIGSRYFQVQTYPATGDITLPQVVKLEARVVHAAADPVGEFAAADPLLKRIRELVRWAQRSNMVSVLTDCPHREKLGWLEQIHLNGPSLRYEFDLRRLFSKAMHDMADAQTADGLIPNIAPELTEFRGTFRAAAEWGAAFIHVAWQQYLFHADRDLIEQFFPAMQDYFNYLETRAESDILHEGLGDWFDLGPRRPPGRAQLTLAPVTATAYFHYNARILAQMAQVLGKQDLAQRYAQRAVAIRQRFNAEFFNPATGYYAGNTQAANALALATGLVAPQQHGRVLANLIHHLEETDLTLTAGAVGYRYLLRALAENDANAIIYRMISRADKPGYAWQLQAGATALTESWEAHATTSNNHFMLGHIIEWFYHDLVGIRPDPQYPGFARVIVQPHPVADLAWAEATYDSVRGPIQVRWERAAEQFVLHLQVPANSRALVLLPSEPGKPVREGGTPASAAAGVQLESRSADRALVSVGSGNYRFETTWKP